MPQSREPKTIAGWVRAAHGLAKEKGWHDSPRDFGTIVALIHSELSEALEEHRNGHTFTEVYKSDGGKPEGIPVEFADVLIRIFDFCGLHGIDLENALTVKHAFNKMRPYRHGGKKA